MGVLEVEIVEAEVGLAAIGEVASEVVVEVSVAVTVVVTVEALEEADMEAVTKWAEEVETTEETGLTECVDFMDIVLALHRILTCVPFFFIVSPSQR